MLILKDGHFHICNAIGIIKPTIYPGILILSIGGSDDSISLENMDVVEVDEKSDRSSDKIETVIW